MIYAFIEKHKNDYGIAMMCKVLMVSKSGYYEWRKKQVQPLSEKEARDTEIAHQIHQSYVRSFGTYGSPRIAQDLADLGYACSQKKIANMMRNLGLSAIIPKTVQRTTDSNHHQFIYPNLVKRQFQVKEKNKVWVADITYIRTLEGWVYLASIMDLYSRKIVGWAVADHMEETLVDQALKHALAVRKPEKGLVHHSDRGAQYCATSYTKTLKEHGIKISMSRKGDPYDNACIESFHATIKKEWIYRHRFESKKEARKSVESYIVNFYNERRRHSTIGYLSPNQFERNQQESVCQNAS